MCLVIEAPMARAIAVSGLGRQIAGGLGRIPCREVLAPPLGWIGVMVCDAAVNGG